MKPVLLRELSLAMTVADIRAAYLATAERIVAADAVGFYLLGGTQGLPRVVSANLGADFLSEYEARGRSDDPVLDHVLRTKSPVDSRRLSADEWERSGARQVLDRARLRHSLQAPLIVAGEVVGTINFARGGAKPFSRGELSTAMAVSKHVEFALERARRYEAMERRASSLEEALERGGGAALICMTGGELLFATKRAVEILGWSARSQPTRGIAAQVARAVRDFSSDRRNAGTDRIDDPVAGRHLILEHYRLRGRDAFLCVIHIDTHAPRAALPDVGVLSRREQEIAKMVARGLTTKEMATEAFISENTVKQHLKRIFMKLGVNSRAQLVQSAWILHASAK